MTIIQPSKKNRFTGFLISALLVSSISVVLWGVFLYNQLVDVRHEIDKQKNNFQQAEVNNAELKNNLYNIIDTKNLKASTNSQSLILDKSPEYIKNRQLVAQN
ncbi:hypothetical protein JW698_03275 [Candidatus Wolfebacteria bacterium]|nr:hypothetical protein [Candidatus Wolfebacteria bacterium]